MTKKTFLVQLFRLVCCLTASEYYIYTRASDQGFADAVVDPDVLEYHPHRVRDLYHMRQWMKAPKVKRASSPIPPFNSRTRIPLHSCASSHLRRSPGSAPFWTAASQPHSASAASSSDASYFTAHSGRSWSCSAHSSQSSY